MFAVHRRDSLWLVEERRQDQRWARLAFKTDKQYQDTLILIMIY